VSDLLSKVTNGMGGETEITYAPSTDYQNTFLPIVVQTVSSYTQKDGMEPEHSYLHKYDYSGGFYDSAEVEFRGFQKVTAYQIADIQTQAYESKTETTYHQDYYKKGKIARQKSYAKLAEGHTQEIVNTWAEPGTPGGGKFPYIETATTTVIDQGVGGPFSYSQTTRNVYDLQTFNLLQEHKNEGSPEEIVTVLEYTADYTNWILSKIIKATVTDASGVIASRKWMDYNAYGELITEELCRSDTPNTGCASRNSGQNVFINYHYDPVYRVLDKVTDPRGYITTTTYDSTKTFVYETKKCVSQPNVEPGPSCTNTYTTTTEYDPGTGNLTKSVPAHLQGTSYWLQTQYDAFGRKKLERMKDNSNPDIPPIVDRGSTSYTYNDTGVATTQWVLKTGRIVIENVPGRTLTLNGYTYFDGMGRTYYAKTNGPEGRWIAVETVFDNIGRVWKQSNPFFEGDPRYYTEFYYDGFSRVTDTVKTDLYQIHTDYEGLRKVVSKQVTAADWQSTAYYYDLNEKLVKVAEGFELPALETFTEYRYDTLGNLTQVRAAKDAYGNNLLGASITTTMTYDSLMKKRSMTDPDMGSWTYQYDKAGNLELQTDNKGQKIRFKYDGLNRAYEKRYGDPTPLSTVYFTYDDLAVPNSKGKLTKVSYQPAGEDLREDSVLEYDLMQRIKKSKKKIGANEVTYEKTYDSAGRVISITYPGNKTYSYEYDVAGDLLYVKDNATGSHLVDYSDFTAVGQHRIANFPKPNNVSVKTTYTYDPPTARLRTLLTQKMLGGTPTETYQNLDYQQFDGAGNIKILADTKNNITHNYTYDHLNRLTLANGVGTNSYTQSYQYDRIGNIIYKSDVGTYNYTYSSRPHAVNSTTGLINITLQYDANGNMTRRASGGITLDITYDYDNKPNLIKKNSINHVQFTYDGNGQRVKKYNYATGQSVLYFGDLYEIRSGADTIHIFAGSSRVASVFRDGTTQFYYTNHLGSASVITDQYGARKEQIEYHPFGTYRAVGDIHGTYDFDPNFPDVFYTFTGQEDDDDLGLYNYGARLYDPVLGKFISPDSVVQAPDDPQTLNRYSYARNNPIIYTDPSGNVFIIDDIIYALAAVIAYVIPSTAGVTAYCAAVNIVWGAISMAGGAALGAATSAATGGDIGMGALTGAISGLIFYGAGNVIPGITGALGAAGKPLAEAAVKVAVHTVAGAISGGINSAITGSNIGLGVLTGAVGAGIGSAAGGALTLLKVDQFGYQLVARVVSGGIAGGVVSQVYGGNFWQGFAQGAATAAAGFLFNHIVHELMTAQNNQNNSRDMLAGGTGLPIEFAKTLVELTELGGELYKTTMAIGKRDYEFFKETGTHQPAQTGSAINWSKVDWSRYDQGNFENTIKYMLEVSKNQPR
jgi:RHS repeat-associated protein